jgi:putative transposase
LIPFAFAANGLEIVKRNQEVKGFQLLPRRWVVERAFGWFGRYRRLSKDYQFQTDTSQSTILIAMIQLMVHRLTRNGQATIPCSNCKTRSQW